MKKIKVKATSKDILQYIIRQEQLEQPNAIYLKWLNKQFKLSCTIESKKLDK